MDVAGFEGMLYTTLLEEPFNNHRINRKEKNMIILYLIFSQHFGILIGETMTYLSCHKNKRPKVLKYDSFIMSLEVIRSKNKKLTSICHDKMNNLAKNCVTMNELMDKFYENIDLSDLICEHYS